MRSFISVSLSAVLVLIASVNMASAAPITVTNNSFENGSFINDGNGTMVLPLGSTTITGWTVTNDQLAWIISPNPWGLAAEDGNAFLDLTAYPTGAPFGGIQQALTTTVNNLYQVSYYLGTYTTRWGGNPVSIQATAGGTSQTCSVSTPSSQSTWTLCTMNFVANSTSTALNFLGTSGFQYIGLDNVSVDDLGPTTSPTTTSTTSTTTTGGVPEPASLALVVSGFALFALRGKAMTAKSRV